jgi:hypothetical protein
VLWLVKQFSVNLLTSIVDTARQLKEVYGVINDICGATKDAWLASLKACEDEIAAILKLFGAIDEKIKGISSVFTDWVGKIQSAIPSWLKPGQSGTPGQPWTMGTPQGGGAAAGGGGYPATSQGGSGYPAAAAATDAAAAAGPNIGALADVRKRFAKELEDPAVQDKLMRLAKAEVGTGNPARTQAFIESVMNQSASRHKTLAQTMSPAYYDALRHGPIAAPSAAEAAKLQAAQQAVLAGGNVSNYATGNWSGAIGRGFGQSEGGHLNRIIRRRAIRNRSRRRKVGEIDAGGRGRCKQSGFGGPPLSEGTRSGGSIRARGQQAQGHDQRHQHQATRRGRHGRDERCDEPDDQCARRDR